MAAVTWIVLVFSILGLAQSACENLLAQDFGFYSDGTTKYSKSHAEKDFPDTKGPYKMVEDGDQGTGLTTVSNSVIKGYFGKGKISAKETGFSWYSMLPKQGTEMSMSYKVKFSEGFDWTKGGKLPGLCGGEGGSGTHCPVGCSEVSKDRGFSTRLMWRSDGRMVTYAYYPDKPKSIRCGEDWNWSQKIQDGVWNHIRTWVKLNTPGEKDGEHRAWLNGEEVLYKTGIRYRYNGDFEISRAYITTYAGGSSRELFAPNQDQEIEFDDFKVWEGDCEEPNGSSGSSSSSDSGESKQSSKGDSRSGGGTMGAPTMVNHDYFLYQQEAGWDIDGAGDLDSFKPDSSKSFEDQLTQCGEVCDDTDGCNIFTYFNGKCYLKANVGASPEFVGATSQGYRWLYIEEDK